MAKYIITQKIDFANYFMHISLQFLIKTFVVISNDSFVFFQCHKMFLTNRMRIFFCHLKDFDFNSVFQIFISRTKPIKQKRKKNHLNRSILFIVPTECCYPEVVFHYFQLGQLSHEFLGWSTLICPLLCFHKVIMTRIWNDCLISNLITT